MPPVELIEKRQENSKTFKLDDRKNQMAVSIGAIHYKDDYSSNEQWKDIDLTWEGNRITKAPYELTIDGKKLTLKNKQTGKITTIELDSIGGQNIPAIAWQRSRGLARIPNIARDTDLEIIVEFSAVRFRRILKSAKAPLEAKFRVTGDTTFVVVRASDEDGNIPVKTSLKDGILTETLKPDREVKYPIRIDPTWQVGASSDDCRRRLQPSYLGLADSYIVAGYDAADSYEWGSGMRFTNITVPNGATIDGAYLTLRSYFDDSSTVVNTKISAEDIDDAPTFADDAAAFDTRWAARTTARVNWDGIAAWTTDVDYDSPEIKTVIQEIVDRGGWNSGQDIVIFWEDFDNRSTQSPACERRAYSYDSSTTYAPKLVVTYTAPVTHYGVATLSGVGTLAGIGRGIFIGQATLSGTGTLASIGRLIAIGKATLTGIGALSAIGSFIRYGKATLSGQGSLSAIGSFWRYGVAALSGTGTLVANGVLVAIGKATLAGTGSLSAIGRRIFTGVATLSGAGTLAGIAHITAIGKATLSGIGTLSAIGIVRGIQLGVVALSGVGILAVSGVTTLIGKITLSGSGSLSAIGSFWQYAKATLTGQGTLVASAVSTLIGKATLSGVGTLSAIGSFWQYGVAVLSGAGTLVANGVITAIGQATLVGTGTLSALGGMLLVAKATLSGIGTLSAIGGLWKYGKVTLSGVGTLTAYGFIVRVIKVTLALYSRALTATLYSRSLTSKLYARAITLLTRTR